MIPSGAAIIVGKAPRWTVKVKGGVWEGSGSLTKLGGSYHNVVTIQLATPFNLSAIEARSTSSEGRTRGDKLVWILSGMYVTIYVW